MQRHFRDAHIEHNVFIPEQGLVPQCRLCKCFGDKVDLVGHQRTDWCRRERKRHRNLQIFREEQQSRTLTFNVRGVEIKRVGNFNYLGRVVSEDDNDSLAIEANLKKERRKWAMFKRLLTPHPPLISFSSCNNYQNLSHLIPIPTW